MQGSQLEMAGAQVSIEDGFVSGASNSDWYKNLKRSGSCLKLLALLQANHALIHQLGPEDITVLHKGVEHGCVALVRFILVDMFDEQGHCNCVLHDAGHPSLTREQLLRKTCSYGSTAVNMVVVSGSPKMVLLLEWAIQMTKHMSEERTQKMSSEKDEEYYDWKTYRSIYLSYLKEKNRIESTQPEVIDDTEVTSLPVPNVKDEDINILQSSCGVHDELISVIEDVLQDPVDLDKEMMEILKESCRKDVDFEFVPLAHVFLHFLSGIMGYSLRLREFGEAVLKRIIARCVIGLDREDGDNGSMLETLFNILDPRGRTFLHVLVYKGIVFGSFWQFIAKQLCVVSSSIKSNCFNAKDGAGRTILHLSCILNIETYEFDSYLELLDLNRQLWSSQDEKLSTLKEWCFPLQMNFSEPFLAIQLTVLFNSSNYLNVFWPYNISNRSSKGIEELGERFYNEWVYSPIQLAATLGRTTILERILEHHTKFNSARDRGLGNDNIFTVLPAVHCAAYCGQVEALQSILKFHIYDSIIQSSRCGTALHLLLNKQQVKVDFKVHHTIVLLHVLPNSKVYRRLKNGFLKLHCDEDATPRMYSANEVSCINLLLQAGIDIWTPHVYTKETPSPGPMANDEARKWWYEKVVNEVVTLKTSISYAANATSVVAALVATSSFIGPLQPPLGYGYSNGYVHTDRSPVRVYLVCNSLSFFFSIGSILMAILPAIPMPKESLYDELLRSQRCLKGAALMLLISIICLLISFSSSSLAVVSSEWHERQLVVASVICGGVICVVVLIIYIIRLLRMLFHRNDWFRRKFAQYMYF